MDLYQEYIHQSRYSRYRDDLDRRETWNETVDRVREFWVDRIPKSMKEDLVDSMEAVRRQDIMPSMRIMMSAGKALAAHHVAGYNCAYVPIDDPRVFSEIVYILMCGTGVGYSVERDYVEKLPEVDKNMMDTETVIQVADSKLGWASAYRELISLLYGGRVPKWDLSKIRPSGARLKTFGGRASGPEPLDDLFRFTVGTFKAATGRKLTTLEVHDVVCKIADIVVVGGVRRSALISLSNMSDERLRGAKSGQYWLEHGTAQRGLANNSIAYTTKPDVDSYMAEMVSMCKDKNGERGIFTRYAAKEKYKDHRRDENQEWGCNPCSEILLRPAQFCNLTEVIVRPEDTLNSLRGKVQQATFLGTLQASLTDFKFLSRRWKTNCDEEALLGVSLTGCSDHKVLNGYRQSVVRKDETIKWLSELRKEAIEYNKRFAKRLGINQAMATTCIKPSGTVSQLCDTASGIHPRFSKHYIRRVLGDVKDPLTKFMQSIGIPSEPSASNKENVVFSFPVEAPDNSVLVEDVDAIEQLKIWQLYNDYYTEHKPSVTIYYTQDEFPEVCAYVWKHFDSMSGIAFLPRDEHVYTQAPYEKIDKNTYKKLKAEMPKTIDWKQLSEFETGDNTTVQPELACTAGGCEL